MPRKDFSDFPRYEVNPLTDEPRRFVEEDREGSAQLVAITPRLDCERPIFAAIGIKNNTGISDVMNVIEDKARIMEIRAMPSERLLPPHERIANTIHDLHIVANVVHYPEEATRILHPDTSFDRTISRGFYGLG